MSIKPLLCKLLICCFINLHYTCYNYVNVGVLPPGVKSVQAPKTNMKMTGPRYKQPTTKCYICGNFIT